jgi:hypothetical protein
VPLSQQGKGADRQGKNGTHENDERERGKKLAVAQSIGRRRIVFFETQPEEPEYEGFILVFFFCHGIFLQKNDETSFQRK